MAHRIQIFSASLHWSTFQNMQTQLYNAVIKKGIKDICIDFSPLKAAYPNGLLPLIVLLEKYRAECDINVSLIQPIDEACRKNLIQANYAAYLCPEEKHPISDKANALHPFTDDSNLNDLINQQIHQVLECATYAKGVLQSFEWALNEVAGNVLVHAQVQRGWMQVVVHPSTKHMAIAVADGGIGIPASIHQAFPAYQDRADEDTIAYALQTGITSRPDFGQGKGLTGTLQIIKINQGGRLAIHSQKGRVEWFNDRLEIKGDFPPFPGTLVDIQLNIAEPIAIEQALWGNAPNYPFNEALYGKDLPLGHMRFILVAEASSFGNRITGEKIRHKIENLLTTAPNDLLEIDFTGVELIASSFADEVFGKLALLLGFVGFGTRIRLIAINQFCRNIIDDVVQSRIIQQRTSRND